MGPDTVYRVLLTLQAHIGGVVAHWHLDFFLRTEVGSVSSTYSFILVLHETWELVTWPVPVIGRLVPILLSLIIRQLVKLKWHL